MIRCNDLFCGGDVAPILVRACLRAWLSDGRPLRRTLLKYIEDPLSEALIQSTLPRPSELEVYLGDTGLFVRPVKETEEEPVVAGGSPPADGMQRCTL